jgi:tryptophan synthase alpha chain
VVVGSAIIDVVAQHGASAPPFVKNYVASLSAAIASAAKEPAA